MYAGNFNENSNFKFLKKEIIINNLTNLSNFELVVMLIHDLEEVLFLRHFKYWHHDLRLLMESIILLIQEESIKFGYTKNFLTNSKTSKPNFEFKIFNIDFKKWSMEERKLIIFKKNIVNSITYKRKFT